MRPVHARVAWVSVVFAIALPAQAHQPLERYVQHVATLSVSPENIDLTLEISFNAQDSLEERRAMDSNKDGVIGADEKKGYLKHILDDAAQRVRLSVDGDELHLVSLYDPELDFYDSRDLEAHPHLLRIFLFARAPKTFKEGSVITLEDTLWESKPAMVQAGVRSKDGIELVSAQSGSALRAGEAETQDRVVKWKCTAIREVRASSNEHGKGEKP